MQVLMVEAEGEGRLAQLLDLIHVGDWASYYLALDNDVDPGPIDAINQLKASLGDRRSDRVPCGCANLSCRRGLVPGDGGCRGAEHEAEFDDFFVRRIRRSCGVQRSSSATRRWPVSLRRTRFREGIAPLEACAHLRAPAGVGAEGRVSHGPARATVGGAARARGSAGDRRSRRRRSHACDRSAAADATRRDRTALPRRPPGRGGGEQLGCAPSTARVHLHRGRARLAALLHEEHDDAAH